MSHFTGRSDFCDWCEMHNNPQEIVEKATVYYGDAKVAINSPHDLIPYYTHLTAMIASDQDGKQTIHLSRDSWIDTEERQFLSHKIISAIKWCRKANKEKIKFDYDFCKKQKDFYVSQYNSESDEKVWKNIISILNARPALIKDHLNKDYRKACEFVEEYMIPAHFSGVHDEMHNRYREQFVKYCSENGYCAFSINFETGEWGYQNQGEWHPVIRNMCFAIADYHRMMKGYEFT